MSHAQLPVIIIADNIRSLYNVGSLFRLADGVNIEALYLCGITGYPKLPEDQRPPWIADRADKTIRKTGLTGVESIPFRYFSTTELAITDLKAKGYNLVALELTETSQDYRQVDYQFPLAVIIGHERDGLTDTVLAAVDTVVHLPMKGQGHSLNVATATAAFLYYLNDRYEQVNQSVN